MSTPPKQQTLRRRKVPFYRPILVGSLPFPHTWQTYRWGNRGLLEVNIVAPLVHWPADDGTPRLGAEHHLWRDARWRGPSLAQNDT